jgi:hypothetical protein
MRRFLGSFVVLAIVISARPSAGQTSATSVGGVLIDENAPVIPSRPRLEGVVTEVTSDGELAKISIGSDDGVNRGRTFVVFRENRLLGRIRILTVTADSAVGRVLEEHKKGAVQRNDVVAIMPPPTLEGSVKQIAADGQLVTISLGERDGVTRGMTFEVFRDDKSLGRIKILATAPDAGVGKLIPEYVKGEIRKDDRVKSRAN